ncbi:MAG: endonuclease III [Bacilli bacterium]|nr:endonuclease III [Bacilli bacterium]MDD3422774.1 endonuclease III [Bacilli bacterium]MDD4065431.1 endonuclease III [Bacilli bacterium]
MTKINKDDFVALLNQLVPDARCELDYHNLYQLVIAVILSAQTTDASVNKATPSLFAKYPDFHSLAKAKVSDVEKLIKTLGLYHIKAARIIEVAKTIINDYQGEVPADFATLNSIPGIGRKTANVILVEHFNVQAFPVDTHIHRIALRLGVAKKSDSITTVEQKLIKYFGDMDYKKLHHQLILFGRYYCTARTKENYIQEKLKSSE